MRTLPLKMHPHHATLAFRGDSTRASASVEDIVKCCAAEVCESKSWPRSTRSGSGAGSALWPLHGVVRQHNLASPQLLLVGGRSPRRRRPSLFPSTLSDEELQRAVMAIPRWRIMMMQKPSGRARWWVPGALSVAHVEIKETGWQGAPQAPLAPLSQTSSS